METMTRASKRWAAATPEEKALANIRTRAWIAANPEYRAASAARDREYRATPEVKARDKERKRTPEYREAAAERTRAWRASRTPEQKARTLAQRDTPEYRATSAERTRAWQVANPEDFRAHARKRRALKRGAKGSFTEAEFGALVEAYDWECAYCGRFTGTPHVEHVVPLSKGGGNGIENIVPACALCNSRKGSKLVQDWLREERKLCRIDGLTSYAAFNRKRAGVT